MESTVTVTSEAESIELKDEDITGIAVIFDTVDDNVTEKRKSLLAKIEITGKITPENQEELRKIFNWAKDFDADTTYRKVVIETSQNKEPLHKYEFDKIFVRDYKEEYREPTEEDKAGLQAFALSLSQKANNLANAKIV